MVGIALGMRAARGHTTEMSNRAVFTAEWGRFGKGVEITASVWLSEEQLSNFCTLAIAGEFVNGLMELKPELEKFLQELKDANQHSS